MKASSSNGWRFCFALAGLLMLAGAPQHPRGTMAEMLAHPKWLPSHSLLLAGFVAMLAGLVLLARGGGLPARTRAWVRYATIGTLLQAIEMAFHTAASVDHANLVAGRSTPVLTTHLWLAVVLYPIFGATTVGLIVAATRERVLGSPWIAWLGILGAVAHGLAAPLVVALGVLEARVLFPLLMLLALWLLLVAAWPRRAAIGDGVEGAEARA